MKSVAIIIRTFNEERWLRHCLEACEDQKTDLNIKIVLIDTGSTDITLKIIKEKGYDYVEYKGDYIPGKVLNEAINSVDCDYYAILSSHCIPTSDKWIDTLIDPLLRDTKIAGVFGRQIPLPNSEDIDKRDLLMTFGSESRYQYKDPFFHNANSCLRGNLIKETNFCEKQTNAEDRVWAKQMLTKGYCIYYESEAKVFHHHGLHQGSPPARVSGVLDSITRTSDENIDFFPKSMHIGNIRISFIILNPDYLEINNKRIQKITEFLKNYLGDKGQIILISENSLEIDSVINYQRSKFETNKFESLSNLIFEASRLIIDKNCSQDFFVYLNLSYKDINKRNIDKLVNSMLNNNYDMCTFAVPAYEHLWYVDNSKTKKGVLSYKPVEKKLLSSDYRNLPYKALYGLGSIFNLNALSENNFPAKLTGLIEPEHNTNINRDRKDDIY